MGFSSLMWWLRPLQCNSYISWHLHLPTSPASCINGLRKANHLCGQRNATIHFFASRKLSCTLQYWHTLIWKIHMCSTQLQQCWHRCRSISSLPSVGEERVVAYYRQALSKPARNYYTTRHERLAIVKVIDYFHPYLYGRQFTIITDHASLQWLLNFKNLEGQMARWLDKLQTYDFRIVYRAGRSHQNADILSCRPCFQTNCKYC